MTTMRALILALGAALLAPSAAVRADDAKAEGGMDVYFIDVMGGAATLIVTPDRQSILVDSGWPGLEDRDPKRIVHVLKDVAGLERIDHLVTTHWHMDHYGGVAGLSRLVGIGRFYDRGLPEDGTPGLDFPDGPKADDPLVVAYREASAGKRTVLKAGERLEFGGLAMTVLASGGRVLEVATPGDRAENPHCDDAPADRPEDRSDNARSLAMKFSLGAFDFLDCGDLTWNVEKRLVCPVDRIGPIDLYQVTHHGMDISNHPTLVRTIAPTVAIMNNGPRKGGSAAVVELLRSVPSIQAAYQLHRNAATGPGENTDPALIANADPAGGRFIHVRVEPGGGRFTVTIGEDAEGRTFESR